MTQLLAQFEPTSLIGAGIVAVCTLGLQWLTNHDTNTKLAGKVERLEVDVKEHDGKITDHGERIIVLEQRLPTPRHHMGD